MSQEEMQIDAKEEVPIQKSKDSKEANEGPAPATSQDETKTATKSE